MPYTIKTGTITDAVVVDQKLPEFERKKTAEEFEQRLAGRKQQILIARLDDEPIGYYVGYEVSGQEFYCWLAGVAPEHRGSGIATRLRLAQERWAMEQGYTLISVKSRNVFPNMLKMLISNGYQISGYEELGGLNINKIHFLKKLVIHRQNRLCPMNQNLTSITQALMLSS